MNEKIRELFHQAYGYPIDVVGEQAEKFAELIVRECADFADEHNDYSEGVTLGVGRALKKHFGIEG